MMALLSLSLTTEIETLQVCSQRGFGFINLPTTSCVSVLVVPAANIFLPGMVALFAVVLAAVARSSDTASSAVELKLVCLACTPTSNYAWISPYIRSLAVDWQ